MIGYSRLVVEAVLCARVGVADEWSHAAAHRQLERARGVRAGAVGSGRCDQPGDGGSPNLDCSAGAVCERGCGLSVCGDVKNATRMHMQRVVRAGMERD